ncbi:MAG: YggS family pyridoxal phosphate-dependent enzyme [Acuticoccus sp.]
MTSEAGIEAGAASVAGLEAVRGRIEAALAARGGPAPVDLVAVSKTFGPEAIRPTLEAGQRIFGENRVQEAKGKWPALREDFSDVELHLLGPLQSNKAKDAVALFDMIESVDREKIATAIARAADTVGRMPRCLVQVNIGREPQKAGCAPDETAALLERCRALGLTVEGLMAIPPAGEPAGPHFAALKTLADGFGLLTSMGMSGDYEEAVAHGARWVRVGSAIFGARPPLV